jgi:hypothetical protein
MGRLIRVDPEVWQRLVERQAQLTVRARRRVSMNDAVRDLLAEAAAEEALAPAAEEEKHAG